MGGDSSLVEEALQDLFVVVWQSAARFRGEATVATWVFQIAHHIALHARQRGDRRLISVPLLAANRSATDGQHDPSAEAVIARLSVHDALDKLSEKHREVLDLFFRQGFSTDEIATILDIPSGTVRSRLSYARKALREQLNDPYLSHERADALTRRGKGA